MMTAEKFLKIKLKSVFSSNDEIVDLMVEFAKLHCIEQAKVINNACDNIREKDFIDDELILNAYSLDLIK